MEDNILVGSHITLDAGKEKTWIAIFGIVL